VEWRAQNGLCRCHRQLMVIDTCRAPARSAKVVTVVA
jgi:hypothetical protein